MGLSYYLQLNDIEPYDKWDAFPFSIAGTPYGDNNISISTFHATVGSGILHLAKKNFI